MIRLGSRTSAGTGAGSTPRDRARASGDHGDGAGRACLTVSALLVRRARRCPDRADEQTLFRVAQVLNAVHRSVRDCAPAASVSAASVSTVLVSPAVLRSIERLAEHLERLERAPHPGADRAGPGARGGR